MTLVPRDRPSAGPDRRDDREPAWHVIELLFFAYREFVADADHELQSYGFGRAHHRVLHFVNRLPGVRVADLLDILGVTKQSLGRVLKDLIATGFIEQRTGPEDRRQRLLHVTSKGEELAMRLARVQTERIRRALGECGPGGSEAARRFLLAMIDPSAREDVERLIARADHTRRPR